MGDLREPPFRVLDAAGPTLSTDARRGRVTAACTATACLALLALTAPRAAPARPVPPGADAAHHPSEDRLWSPGDLPRPAHRELRPRTERFGDCRGIAGGFCGTFTAPAGTLLRARRASSCNKGNGHAHLGGGGSRGVLDGFRGASEAAPSALEGGQITFRGEAQMRGPTQWSLLVLCVLLAGVPSLAGDGPSASDPVNASIAPARDLGPSIETMIVNGKITGSQPSTGAVLLGQDPDSAGVTCSGVLVGCDSFLTAGSCVCRTYPCDPTQIDPTQLQGLPAERRDLQRLEREGRTPTGLSRGPISRSQAQQASQRRHPDDDQHHAAGPVPEPGDDRRLRYTAARRRMKRVRRHQARRRRGDDQVPVRPVRTSTRSAGGSSTRSTIQARSRISAIGDEGGPLFVDFGNGPVGGRHA